MKFSMKVQREIDQNIELFFFNPLNSRDQYIEKYKEYHQDRMIREEGGYRYSTLFICIKDIKHAMFIGKRHPAFFTSIVLLDVAVRNIAKIALNNDIPRFLEKYMGIRKKDNCLAIRELRNAIMHSGYSLYTYCPKKVIKGKKREKIYFTLGLFDQPIKRVVGFKKDYPARLYNINPRTLFTLFQYGTRKLKEELLDHKNVTLRKGFKDNLDIDNWILITSGLKI